MISGSEVEGLRGDAISHTASDRSRPASRPGARARANLGQLASVGRLNRPRMKSTMDGDRRDDEPADPEMETPATDDRRQQTRETPEIEPGAAGADRQRARPEIEAPVGDLVAPWAEGEAEPRGGGPSGPFGDRNQHHESTDRKRGEADEAEPPAGPRLDPIHQSAPRSSTPKRASCSTPPVTRFDAPTPSSRTDRVKASVERMSSRATTEIFSASAVGTGRL